jgi:hypothetical protein
MAGRPSGPTYVIDSSSWISIEAHPAQNRILWLLGTLIESGRAICPPEVKSEVQSCPNVLAWLDQYKGRHVRRVEAAEYLLKVGEVARRFPQMAGVRGTKERADQYVVGMTAYLTAKSGTPHVAVSEEGFRRPGRKISTACAHFGVGHMNLMDMLRNEYPDEGL